MFPLWLGAKQQVYIQGKQMKKSNLQTDRLRKIITKTSIKGEQTNGQRKLKTEYSLMYGIF